MPAKAAPRQVTLRPKAPPAGVLRAARGTRLLLPIGGGGVTLFEDKVRVHDTTSEREALPRRYTLTSDNQTAELDLTVSDGDGWKTLDQPQDRERRAELLAELTDDQDPRLMVTYLVGSGDLSGKAVEPARRRPIVEREMPLALAVIRYGDRFFFERHPELDQARVVVEHRASDPRFEGQQEYGRITDYRVTRIAGESRRLAFGAAVLAALGIGALVIGTRRKGGEG